MAARWGKLRERATIAPGLSRCLRGPVRDERKRGSRGGEQKNRTNRQAGQIGIYRCMMGSGAFGAWSCS